MAKWCTEREFVAAVVDFNKLQFLVNLDMIYHNFGIISKLVFGLYSCHNVSWAYSLIEKLGSKEKS